MLQHSAQRNYRSLLATLLIPESFFFAHHFDGQDVVRSTLYCGNEVAEDMEAQVIDSQGVLAELEKKEADAGDVNQLTANFLNDWRTVE